jgi:hypothetical protein
MQPTTQTEVHPDCWWGPNGIDALCWADGIPYEFEGGGR